MSETLRERQLEREDQQVSLGIDRYYKHVGKVSQSETGPGMDLAFRAVKVTAQGIEDLTTTPQGRGRPDAAIEYLKVLEPVAAAYITARCVINGMAQQARVQNVALQIASQIEEHFQFDELQTEAPALSNSMRRKAEKWTTSRARRFIMRLGVKIAGVRGLEWKQADKLRLGMKLIEVFIERTGFAQTVSIKMSASVKSAATVLRATEATSEWLQDEHRKMALNSPRHLPMLVPPRDWTSPVEGGYLTTQNRIPLIGGVAAELRDDMFSTDMDRVYSALNTVQSTPWRVNEGVLDVLSEVWKSGGTLGGLPSAEDLPLPARPADIPEDMSRDDMDEEQLRRINEFRAETRKVHEQNAALISKRLSLATQISMASENRNEDQFYFPHNLDFRGRMYSVVAGLNPQGDDTGKALIQFAEGKPLGTSGGYWLAVHIANLFGVDKCSFDDRVTWVQDNQERIKDSALNPLDGDRFWCEADYPYCALAACFEWVNSTYGMDEDFISYLPIAMDGSCSGLQHFSAMLRDQAGGVATNLTNQRTPADIYTEVAERTEQLLAQSGDPELNYWHGQVTRKIVKRPCMTFAYSVTSRGMRDQILDELRKQADGGEYIPGVDNFKAATDLAPLVEQAIRGTVERAAEAMSWLQDAVRVYFEEMVKVLPGGVSEDSIPISWYTPDGFPTQQRYAKMNGKRFDVWFQGTRMKIQLRVPTKRPDTRKQVSGIAPNFVHSMDACHLRMVVNRMVDEGVTTSFAMIHDSFGTHACDVDELHAVIRDEFINLYSVNRLAEFRAHQLSLLPEGTVIEDVPADGELDLEEVRDADFFFA